MNTCTFFGHRDCPETVRPVLETVLTDLICRQAVTTFYVGNQGRFDAMVHGTLKKLQQEFPHIHFGVVLAYPPRNVGEYETFDDTMLPEGMELVHPKYAISRRNNWMLKQANWVVTYITQPWGGAALYAAKAQRMGKQVINLGNMDL